MRNKFYQLNGREMLTEITEHHEEQEHKLHTWNINKLESVIIMAQLTRIKELIKQSKELRMNNQGNKFR